MMSLIASNREGIENVRQANGKFAFLTESVFNEYANERLPCDTMRIGKNLNTKSYGITIPLGSDLREAISRAVLELKENGFLERLKQKWYYERSECTNFGTKEFKRTRTLNLLNVASMLYILIMSLGISMVLAVLEVLLKTKIRSNRLNQYEGDATPLNLKSTMTTIDSNPKQQNVDCLPLQLQQQPDISTSNIRNNEP